MQTIHRKLLLVLVLFAVLHLPALTVTSQTETKSPTLWGTNYYVEFWEENETAQLIKLPLSYVRWGGNASDQVTPNEFTAFAFADLMHKQNMEPIFQINVRRTSPETAASIVKSVNIDQKGNLKYWSVGNEPELFISTHNDDMTLEEYLKRWRETVEAMKAVDPSILIAGPDVSLHMTVFDKEGEDWRWFDGFIKANGDLVDVVTFHFYPFGNEEVEREAIFDSIDAYAKSLPQLRNYLRETLKRDVPLMLTETNINWNGGVYGDTGGESLFAGLWLAEICGISAQNELASVLIWSAVRGGNLSLLDEAESPRPTYYTFQALAGYGLPVEAESLVDGLKVYASATDEKLILMVVNRTAADKSVKLNLDISFGGYYTLQAGSVTLGAYSFTRLEFDKEGAFVAGTTYGEKENSAKAAPSEITLES